MDSAEARTEGFFIVQEGSRIDKCAHRDAPLLRSAFLIVMNKRHDIVVVPGAREVRDTGGPTQAPFSSWLISPDLDASMDILTAPHPLRVLITTPVLVCLPIPLLLRLRSEVRNGLNG